MQGSNSSQDCIAGESTTQLPVRLPEMPKYHDAPGPSSRIARVLPLNDSIRQPQKKVQPARLASLSSHQLSIACTEILSLSGSSHRPALPGQVAKKMPGADPANGRGGQVCPKLGLV